LLTQMVSCGIILGITKRGLVDKLAVDG
jgi:hypothetical protein